MLPPVGCNAAGQINSGSQAFNDKVESVRSVAKQVCAYVPTVATVVSIFNSGFAGDAAMVASAICNAATTAPLPMAPATARRASMAWPCAVSSSADRDRILRPAASAAGRVALA